MKAFPILVIVVVLGLCLHTAPPAAAAARLILATDTLLPQEHVQYTLAGLLHVCECKQRCVEDPNCRMVSILWSTSASFSSRYDCLISYNIVTRNTLVATTLPKAHTYYRTEPGEYYPCGNYFYRNNEAAASRKDAKLICNAEGGELLYGVTEDDVQQMVSVFKNSRLPMTWVFAMKVMGTGTPKPITGILMKNGDGGADAMYAGDIELVTQYLPDTANNYNILFNTDPSGTVRFELNADDQPFICQRSTAEP